MAEHFKIVFEGLLRPGVDLQTARLNLAQLFKSDVSSVDPLFTGKPITVKRGLTHDDAQRYLKVLNEAGVEARIEPEQPVSWTLEEITEPAPSTTAYPPGAQYERPVAPQAASPYAPPRAAVVDENTGPGELNVMSIDGRIGRLRFMAWSMVMVTVLMIVIDMSLSLMSVSMVSTGLLIAIAGLVFVVFSCMTAAKRLHDVGWSAWLLLIALIPAVGGFFSILLMIIPGNVGSNRYGPPPPPNHAGVKVLAFLWSLVIVAACLAGIMDGMSTFQEEVEVTTDAYEQSLPYDDDSSQEADN